MSQKTKIIMVCLGNICRSPLAEGILSSKLPKERFFIDSAGTGNWHEGESPDLRSIAIAQKKGIDISKQKAKHFTTKTFEDFDHIFVMDRSNLKNVLALAPNEKAKEKVQMILDTQFPNKQKEVPDPYYGTEKDFEQVYDMLDEVCNLLVKKMI
jgi:protein-tyrosine phosphatase